MIHYDPRTIAYITELIHFPMQHDPAAMRRLYNRLGEHAGDWYLNFNVDPAQGGAQLVTAKPLGTPTASPMGPMQQQQVSAVTLMPDRIQVQEEMTELSLDGYLDRLAVVAEAACEELRIPQVNAQQCTVRSLVSPRSVADSREFLAGRVLGAQGEPLEGIGRPVGMVGIRFMFPQTEDDPSVFNVRVESYNADPRSLFLEVAAVFPGNVEPQELGALTSNVQRTYDFLESNLCDFVARFDERID